MIHFSEAMTKSTRLFYKYLICLTVIFYHLSHVIGDEADDDDECRINIHSLQNKEPLIMTAKSPPKFMYPKVSNPNTIIVEDEDPVRLVCGIWSYVATCNDRKFRMSGSNAKFDISNIYCTAENAHPHLIKPAKNVTCPQNVVCLYIGFQINMLDFIPTIDLIWFNDGRKRPLWAHTTLVSVIEYRQLRGETRGYKKDILFDKMSTDMDSIFDKNYQKRRLTKILKDSFLAELYISDSEYLVKGQLIDNDDFFYKPQQDTVHYYANVMPMWLSVVRGNWFITGAIARKIAGDVRSNLDLWSGAIDTLELEDYKRTKKEIYMATEDNGQDVVPVPKILFKYMYDSKTNRGMVMLTVNNPYLTRLTSDNKLCDEQPIGYILHPEFRNFSMGYTYCCTVQDFAPIAKRRGLPTFPNAQTLL